jgi:hypothetical protein
MPNSSEHQAKHLIWETPDAGPPKLLPIVRFIAEVHVVAVITSISKSIILSHLGGKYLGQLSSNAGIVVHAFASCGVCLPGARSC